MASAAGHSSSCPASPGSPGADVGHAADPLQRDAVAHPVSGRRCGQQSPSPVHSPSVTPADYGPGGTRCPVAPAHWPPPSADHARHDASPSAAARASLAPPLRSLLLRPRPSVAASAALRAASAGASPAPAAPMVRGTRRDRRLVRPAVTFHGRGSQKQLRPHSVVVRSRRWSKVVEQRRRESRWRSGRRRTRKDCAWRTTIRVVG